MDDLYGIWLEYTPSAIKELGVYGDTGLWHADSNSDLCFESDIRKLRAYLINYPSNSTWKKRIAKVGDDGKPIFID